jgi:hypothetical protein
MACQKSIIQLQPTDMRIINLTVIAFAMAVTSCGNKGNSGHVESETENIKAVTPAIITADSNTATHIKLVLASYLEIKTALVAADAPKAQSSAANLTALTGADVPNFPEQEKKAYEQYAAGIRQESAKIASTTDIAQQRETFSRLSTQVYELLKQFDAGQPVYHEYCPMALNDKGAMWLSESQEIRNPYFGDEMLECGSVEEVIKR